MINKFALAVIAVLLSNLVFSQGLIEVPLNTNPILLQKWNEIKNQKSALIKPSISDTLTLGSDGILDDFSKPGPFPDTSLWLDNYVFINRDYPIAPPTIGVATFDGVNEHGYPYNFLANQYTSGKADMLTSKRINLKGKTAADSIWLSFYYQPQGRGNAPESADSLIVEFGRKTQAYKTIHDTTFVTDTLYRFDSVSMTYVVASTYDSIAQIMDYTKPYDSVVWSHQWAHNGYPLATNDSSWHFVMLPVSDTAFLKGGFQFRFRNWATLSGNGDQWSIDNVYLNTRLNRNDTLLDDVSFIYDPPSLLQTYTAMPWNHYQASAMRHSFNFVLRNNYNIGRNTHWYYNINDASGLWQSGGNNSGNVNPYSTSGYHIDINNYVLPTIPSLLTTGPTTYTFEQILSCGDINTRNDTVRLKQNFSNYYAYDDGSAESAFALGGTSMTVGELAQQFTSTILDTLRCIDIYFNPLWNDARLYSIVMKVWADNGAGQPDDAHVLYSDNINPPLSPNYDSAQYGPDHFIRYYLLQPLILPASTFYVGFLQNTNQFLNVGVDKRTNQSDKVFYNTTGTWYTSPYPGTLMMRAVFGSAAEFVGLNEIKKSNSEFSIYPNPANDRLYFQNNSLASNTKVLFTIMDVVGRTIVEGKSTTTEFIDISNLSEGVYFVRLQNEGSVSIQKFIKAK